MIKELHAGANPQEVEERFKRAFEAISPLEIAKVEQELIREGLSREEIRKFCDVHMSVLKEQLERQKLNVPPSHFLSILAEEHKIMLRAGATLINIVNKAQQINNYKYMEEEMHQLHHIVEEFEGSEKHYLREENVLSPILEKHGITKPPAIMWMEHDQVRDGKMKLAELIKSYGAMELKEFKEKLNSIAKSLNDLLSNRSLRKITCSSPRPFAP